ncbi:MAG: AAA family ATPase [Planctomycetota bacterium]
MTIVPAPLTDALYGRQREMQALRESFFAISRGEGRVVLVPGHSGSGKTALVTSLDDHIQEKHGWFAKGKFNQYQADEPYLAIRQALLHIWQQMRNAPEEQAESWVTTIRDALGDFGHVLADLLPELAPYVQDKQAPSGINPQEARHRFVRVVRTFLKIICRPEHPVVLFLDDWQWADSGSIELLRQLEIGTEVRYLLLVVAYRDEEVGPDHPLHVAMGSLERRGPPLVTIPVRNLALGDVRALIHGTLGSQLIHGDQFTSLVYEVSAGNPLHILAFLDYLMHWRLLWQEPSDNEWRWRIDREQIPVDIVDLFVRRLRRYDEARLHVLSMAACLGNTFDITSLAVISGSSVVDCRHLLQQAVTDGFVLSPSHMPAASKSARHYTFAHDRIQQAAFQLIPLAQRPRVHMDIAHLLMLALQPQERDQRLFELVGHLNQGRSLLESDAERIDLIHMNEAAAQKARAATAYASMRHYFATAVSLAADLDGGVAALLEHDHQLTIAIQMGLGEGEFLEGNPQAGEQAIRQAAAWASLPIERGEIMNALIVNLTLLARYQEAIGTGRQALADLGVQLPETEFEKARDIAIDAVYQALAGRDISLLADDPSMDDAGMRTATKLLITMGPPCYRTHQRLWSVIVPLVVRITIEYGLIPEIGYSHTAFGGLLGWVRNDYADARAFAQVAMRVMQERFEQPNYQSMFYLMLGSSSRHWFEHPRMASEDYRQAYEIGLRSGNLQYAAYGYGHDMYCAFFRGVGIPALIAQTRHALAFSTSRLNIWAIDLLSGGMSLFKALSEQTDGASFAIDDDAYRRHVDDNHNVQVQAIYLIIKSQCLLFLGQIERALNTSREAEDLLYTVGTQGLMPWPEHVLTRFLILAAVSRSQDSMPPERRRELMAILRQLEIWSQWSPECYTCKLLLARAEMASLEQDEPSAARLYDEAIAAALAQDFTQWAAFANECASRFWRRRGKERMAQVYWQQAYNDYHRWGAQAKLAHMESQHLQLLLPERNGDVDSQTVELIGQKQLSLLRSQALQGQEVDTGREMTELVDELALATERLRVEIAEHKRTAERLLQSQALLTASQAVGRIGGWAMNLDTLQATWTEQTYALHGLDPGAEVDLDTALAFYLPQSRRILQDAVQALIEHHRPYDLKLKIRTTRGEVRDVHVIGKIDEAHRQLYGVIQDITERMALEEQLNQSEKMRAIGQLAGGIAHDFNNQLTGVLGFAELLHQRIEDPDLRRFCEGILEAGRRSAELTKQLLAYSRKGRYTYTPIDIHEIINEVASILGRSVNKNIKIRKELDAHPRSIMGDGSQIQSAIMNLGLNACDAMPEGGTLTFRTEILSCDRACGADASAPCQGDFLQMMISDTGTGIAKDLQDQIFEPFFTTKEVGKGSGMGLAAVYGTVKSHNGCIWVDSAPGEGATFTICLPTTESAQYRRHIERSTSFERVPRHVLVIDDEEIVRRLAADVLELAGHTVVTCASGEAGVAYYRQHAQDIDVIILDMIMPGMNGKQTFEALRAIDPGAVIILASGHSLDSDTRELLRCGAHAFLQKPFSREDLDSILRQNLTS